MFKKFLLICAVICSMAFCYSCSKDDPDNPKQEENKEPEKPTEDEDGAIVYIGLDGTTYPKSNFRWLLHGKSFMLNYIEYEINGSHISITGCDKHELEATLNGKLEIIPTMVIDGETYKVRDFGNTHTFSKNEDIKVLILPNTLLSISDYAFEYCKELGSPLGEILRIPDSVTKIGMHAFYDTDYSLVILPKSLKEIGKGAFDHCRSLVSICCRSTTPPVLKDPIVPTIPYFDETINDYKNITSVIHLYVPKGTLDAYKKAGWDQFTQIEEYIVED